ncbi:MAG: thioredoxin domain-containing protein, partial [Clostridia bacterium]|nr:thioredoxin domain-containing protein [Clostridia bacterium]
GEKTEVYSRITGYYRPVQNWNDGKTQEFKDRKVYDIGNSHLKKTVVGTVPAEQPAAGATPAPEEVSEETNGAILFATPTCPNCKLAAALLEKAGVPFTKLIAEEHPDLVAKFGVKQAPTLVIPDGEGFEKFKGVSDIKGWLMSRQ